MSHSDAFYSRHDDDEISTNNFPSFPDQQTIKKYLKKLKLLVRREEYEGQELWVINYREAVVAIATSIVGPPLLIAESEQDEDRVPISKWYETKFAVGEGQENKI